MALTDTFAVPPEPHRPRVAAPKGWEPGVHYVGGQPTDVTVTLQAMPEDEQAWRTEIKRVTGLVIPESRQVVLTDTRYWGAPGAEQVYARFKIVDRPTVTDTLDVDGIVRAVKAVRRKSTPEPTGTGKSLVVVLADMQVGKVDSRGGTEELIERVMTRLNALESHAKRVKADTCYLVDAGDCIESDQQTGAQAFTNDLSVPEQLRIARRLYTDAIIRLAKLHSRVVVLGVPSNHGRWRRGKDALGKPGDDYGIETLTAIADALTLNPDAFGHVSFILPDVWEETIAVDTGGTIVAVAHGHQVNKPEQIPDWWARQVHGGQPAADADILITGHFHHLRVQPTGRSAHTGRAKWWIQAPTVDSGSSWYRHRRGDDSDPGLLTFTTSPDGWDNLKLL